MKDNKDKIWGEFSGMVPFGDCPSWMFNKNWSLEADIIHEAITTMVEDSKIEDGGDGYTYEEILSVVDSAIDEHNFKRRFLK